MRNITKAMLTGALLVAAYIVAPGALPVEAQEEPKDEVSDCVYAEYINWYGACRGATIRLCKGGADCPHPNEPE